MSAPRPFVRRVVVLAPAAALGDLGGWARRWTEAGADALALAADPGDPAAQGLLLALRRATPLPLEAVTPAGVEPAAEWAGPLAAAEVDCLLPARPPGPEADAALARAGVAWGWPLAAGPAPARAVRVHAEGAGRGTWQGAPAGAERSLIPADGEPPSVLGDSGADTLMLPAAALAQDEPAAGLAGWR